MNRQTAFATDATRTFIDQIHTLTQWDITPTVQARAGTQAVRIATLALWIRNRRKGEEDDK